MIPSLSYLIKGFRVLRVTGEGAAPLLELCRRYRIPYEDFTPLPDGGISLRFALSDARRVERLGRSQGLCPTCTSRGGIPVLLRRLLRRPGLWVGGILGLALYILAGSVFWDIRISGNEGVSDHSILTSLSECGLSVGTPLRGFRADVTENRVLLLDDRLAWLSINRKGTVAYVEVREAVPVPDSPSEAPCDVVAAEGGVIVYVELESGNVRVQAGQTVSKGQVLVSGISDSPQTGIRLERASARVFAKTVRQLQVTVPLSYEGKRYHTAASPGKTGIFTEKSVIFFGRHIKFSKKSGNLTGFCDIIENEKSWGLADGVGFPVSTRTLWYLPYEITAATRSYAEAEELAYLALARYIASLPGGATLLSKTVRVSHGEESLTLSATLTVIEDIGTERRIEVALD